VWAPAAYTFLAMEVGTWGWITIGALVVVAAAAIAPAARAAERHLARVGAPGQAVGAG
jgi:ABC-type lipoprotein release transport system permease subunit